MSTPDATLPETPETTPAALVGDGGYNASKITVLEGLEAVRMRPSMYIGDTGERGLHHLVYEVVDNSIDEALAGYCKNIQVIIHVDDSITVTDDGRGIPVDMHPEQGKPACEVALTILHAGGKFDHDSYKVSGGLHGVGVSCVNALSAWLELRVQRDGGEFHMRFERGATTQQLSKVRGSDKRGTTITFKPDHQIFTVTDYKWDILSKRLRELAFLNAGIRITHKDERSATLREEVFCYTGGIREFVKHLNEGKQAICDVIYFRTTQDGVVLVGQNQAGGEREQDIVWPQPFREGAQGVHELEFHLRNLQQQAGHQSPFRPGGIIAEAADGEVRQAVAVMHAQLRTGEAEHGAIVRQLDGSV